MNNEVNGLDQKELELEVVEFLDFKNGFLQIEEVWRRIRDFA